MKKIMALLLALAMALALCCCGSENKPDEEPVQTAPQQEEAPEATEEPKAADEPATAEEDPAEEEPDTQTISEHGASVQIPAAWPMGVRKEYNNDAQGISYNFSQVGGDPYRTLQIAFGSLNASPLVGDTTEEKYEALKSILISFDDSTTDFGFSQKDDAYIGTGTFYRQGCTGRITIIVRNNTMVSVAALESPEMSEEYLAEYARIVDSVEFP